MAHQYAESAAERFERYQKAANRLQSYWQSILKDVYDYCIPGRNTWETPTEGESKTTDIYDDTAVVGVQNFATNILSFLMPPFKEFMSLEVSNGAKSSGKYSDTEIQQIEKSLQDQVTTLFEYLNQSGYGNAFHEAFQDLAAGTGVIIINEGDDEHPFHFSSVPLDEIAMEEGPNGKLENFWRTKEYTLRQIMRYWPEATLPHNLQATYQTAPDSEVEIIEGVIYYPDNDDEYKYFYYVQTVNDKVDIYTDYRDYSPFLGFRYGKTAGEVMGRGPALLALDFIRILNLLAEYDLRSAKFDAFNAYTVPNTAVINPNTAYLEPGALIPVDSQFAGQSPIQPLPVNQNKNTSQLRIQEYQSIVKEILAADPLPSPEDRKNATATEVNIRYKEWTRKNSSSVLRLQEELIMPFFKVLLKILRKKALIQDIVTPKGILEIKVGNKFLNLIYDSPIMDAQKDEELQAMDQLLQRLTQVFQQYAILGVDFPKLPNFWADKLNANMDMIKSPGDIQNILGKIMNALQQQQQPQQNQLSPQTLALGLNQ